MAKLDLILLIVIIALCICAMIAVIVTCAIVSYVEVWYYKKDSKDRKEVEQECSQEAIISSDSSSDARSGSISDTGNADTRTGAGISDAVGNGVDGLETVCVIRACANQYSCGDEPFVVWLADGFRTRTVFDEERLYYQTIVSKEMVQS